MKRARVAVLAGGDSPEREVSRISGRSVHQALVVRGYDAHLLEIDTLDDLVPGLRETDVVFSVLHGGSGEDGTVQLLLDVLEIPYAGSNALASYRAMDKAKSKAAFALKRIPVPYGRSFEGGDLQRFLTEVMEATPFPLIVKPTGGGSTIGVRCVRDATELFTAASETSERYGAMLVEAFIAGRELTVGVLLVDGEHIALPTVEILFPSALFDYEAKYTEGLAEFIVPANLDAKTGSAVRKVALQAHEALGCYGFSRVDIRLSSDGTPYVLELNALPGMTPMSDLPRAAAAAGITYEDLVERMLETAWKEKKP